MKFDRFYKERKKGFGLALQRFEPRPRGLQAAMQSSAETERKFFEFEQNEQVSFRAERVSSKIFDFQFSSRASSSKIFSSGQKLRANLERAQAYFRAKFLVKRASKNNFFSSKPQILSQICPLFTA